MAIFIILAIVFLALWLTEKNNSKKAKKKAAEANEQLKGERDQLLSKYGIVQIRGGYFVFFDRLKELCDQRRISPYKACTDVGLNRAAVAKWKKGSQPNGATAIKLADYLGVSVDYLLGNEEKPLINDDQELTEYLEVLKNRAEMRMLFQLAKDATKEDVEKAVRIIEALREK